MKWNELLDDPHSPEVAIVLHDAFIRWLSTGEPIHEQLGLTSANRRAWVLDKRRAKLHIAWECTQHYTGAETDSEVAKAALAWKADGYPEPFLRDLWGRFWAICAHGYGMTPSTPQSLAKAYRESL